MPELPEVETTRAGIESGVVGQPLTDFKIHNAALRWPVELPTHLRGEVVHALVRRGKYIVFLLSPGAIILHLGMSGSLRWATDDLRTHDHVELMFGSQTLRLNDPRRFGCIRYQPGDDYLAHPLLSHLGVEPLGNEFHGNYLFNASRKKKVAVKNFIMDSKVVVGVGNIYAAESLFLAGIRPGIAAGSVSAAGYENLTAAIKKVLADAVRQGGTTLRNFSGSDGTPGYFKQYLYVYGRDGEPCRVCQDTLKFKSLGNRSTVYCSRCQTNRGHVALGEAGRIPS